MSNDNAATVSISVSSIISFHGDDNVSRAGTLFRDEQDRNVLALQLARRGYDLKIGNPLTVYKLDARRQAEAVKQLTKKWIEVKAARDDRAVRDGDTNFTITPRDYEAAWRDLYTKADKVITPTYGGVAGHRRTDSLALANAFRDKLAFDAIVKVPCLVEAYDSDLERYQACVLENTMKNVGTRKLSYLDLLQASSSLYNKGCKEKVLGTLMARGTAQKHYAICRLNQKAPELGLLEGLLTDAISYGPIDKEKTRKLNKELESEQVKSEDLELSEVLERINGNAGKNAAKMASKDDITAAAQSPVQLIEFTLQCVIKNQTERLGVYIDDAPQINAAVEAIQTSNPKILAVLAEIMKSKVKSAK